MARVLWRDAQGNEGSIELGLGETRIGRAMDCGIRTDDAMVSRHHARLYWSGRQYVVEDLGSANGVFYQERRVTQHLLNHGDAVRCGSLWLRFVDEAQAAHMQRDASALLASRAHTAEPVAGASPAPPPALDESRGEDEVRSLRRRLEQMQAELRIVRAGKLGAQGAQRLEELENDYSGLEAERDELRRSLAEARASLEAESGSKKVQHAERITRRAAELATSLNDVLSNLRINVMAAEGEFEQFAQALPKASFELIREALRSSSTDVAAARELLKDLRELDD